MRIKKAKRNKVSASKPTPKTRRQANKELKEALSRFNSLDHTGKPIRQIIGEVGEIVGQVVRRKIKLEENESPPSGKKRRASSK